MSDSDMGNPEDRREAERVQTDLIVNIQDEKEEVLDERAIAHDVSETGFKIQTQAILRPGQILLFFLNPGPEVIRGKARVAWVKKTDASYWVGAEFTMLNWSGRQRLRGIISPYGEWAPAVERLTRALGWLVAALLLMGLVSALRRR